MVRANSGGVTDERKSEETTDQELKGYSFLTPNLDRC